MAEFGSEIEKAFVVSGKIKIDFGIKKL